MLRTKCQEGEVDPRPGWGQIKRLLKVVGPLRDGRYQTGVAWRNYRVLFNRTFSLLFLHAIQDIPETVNAHSGGDVGALSLLLAAVLFQ